MTITKKQTFLFSVFLLLAAFIGGYYFYDSSSPHIVEFNYARDKDFITNLYNENKYWLFEGNDTGFIEHLLKERSSIFEKKPYERENIKLLFKHNEPIGFVTFAKTKFYHGKIRLLSVSDNYRSKGYGSLLLNYAMDDLLSRGCNTISLITRVNNYRAHKIYKKAGFTQTDIFNGLVRFEYHA